MKDPIGTRDPNSIHRGGDKVRVNVTIAESAGPDSIITVEVREPRLGAFRFAFPLCIVPAMTASLRDALADNGIELPAALHQRKVTIDDGTRN